MKNIFIKSILVAFFGMFLILTSCAKKNSSAQNRAGVAPRGDAGAVGNTGTTLGINKCTNGTYTTGRVYNDTAGVAFRTAWVDFFSAIFAENQFGNIDGSLSSTTTGVNFELKLKVVNGQVDRSQTTLNMEVRDSMVDQRNGSGEIIQPIKIYFSSAESVSLSGSNVSGGTGQFTATFADKYGKISVTGNYNQTNAQGTVTFANSTHYNGESPRSGTLGNFTQNSCGLFF